MRTRLSPAVHRRIGCGRGSVRDESGVIAIIVALSISTFLLGFAALAVDLGTAYVRKAELKSLAEKVAIAGATSLPTIPDGLSSALGALGSTGSPGTGLCADLDLPGVCTAPAGWSSDNNPANGEITFYGDEGQEGELADQNGDGILSTLDKVTSGDAVGIHVILPPSQVPFGLASTLGFDSASLQQTATARIGTPLGSGILPFGLTPVDLTNGQFCVKDPSLPPVSVNPYPGSLSRSVLTITPDTFDPDLTNQTATVTIRGPRIPADIQVYFENASSPQRVTSSSGIWTVAVPDGEPGTTVRVWATYVNRLGTTTTTQPDTITYSGTAPTGIDPCTFPQSDRGFVQLARSTAGDTLESNIRLSPEVKLYPTGGLLGTLGTTLGCVSTTLSSPSTTCLASVLGEPFSARMTEGMFDSDAGKNGRLVGDCGGGTYAPRGHNGVDASQLLAAASPLVDSSFGSANALKTSLLSGTTPVNKEGWIRSTAFRCPRLAVMPVLDQNPLTGVIGGQNITKLTYVWIDDDGSSRGLSWNGGTLRTFRGYVVHPKYLPEIVAGSPIVGPYLGDDMPKEALLIPDFPSL